MQTLVVKTLLVSLISIVFSGCAPAFQQCKTPDVVKPTIRNHSCDGNFECVYEKVMKNYEEQKKYGQLLEEANKVCK